MLNNSASPNGYSAADFQFLSWSFSVYQPKSVQMIKIPQAQEVLYASICGQAGVFDDPNVETINVATIPTIPNSTLIWPLMCRDVGSFSAACRLKRAVDIVSGAKQERIQVDSFPSAMLRDRIGVIIQLNRCRAPYGTSRSCQPVRSAPRNRPSHGSVPATNIGI